MDNILNQIKSVVDNGSFIEISELVEPSVHIGYGTVNSKLVYIIAETGSIINQKYVDKVCSIYDKSVQMGAPILYFIDNKGIVISDANSLSYYGQILKKQNIASGVIPQIAVVVGNCGGGMSLVANACDFVYIDKNNGKLWSVPPVSIENNINNDLSLAKNVSKTMLVDNILSADDLFTNLRELIDFIPSNYEDNDAYETCDDDLNRLTNNFMSIDTLDGIREIADYNKYLEIKTEFGKGVSTGFIRLNGQTIAVIANVSKEKRLCNRGLKKIKKFITFADSFSIPILTIVDVEKFKMEDNGDLIVSLPASRVAFSYVNTTVPKVTLIKNAIGVPGLVMGSKSLSVDLVFSFNNSKIGLMDEKTLAELLYADDIEKAEDKLKCLDEKTNEVKNTYTAEKAASEYLIDDIIADNDARLRLISAFEMLFTKKVSKINKKHGAF